MNLHSSAILLSTAYFPPLPYMACISGRQDILLEKHENYCKQSFRNRCCIVSANGILPLVIPVKRNKGCKTLISEVRPDYSYKWQKLHRVSIESAYRSAPFFEYYIDDIMPFFELRYDWLLDMNTTILNTLLDILNIPANPVYTESYQKSPLSGITDARDIFHPKRWPGTNALPFGDSLYTQVFQEKLGFIGGMSILDLLFNTGPDSVNILHSIRDTYTC
ncbi:MAG: WbqC family protein [Bacteroidales bacterium]